MSGEKLRVGDLARRTGLTVRTLHHWHQIGLLIPGARTPAGHRLYGPDEIRRLQRILSLRAMGLSLDEIRSSLNRGAPTLPEVLRAHRDRVREQLTLLTGLGDRLDRVLKELDRGKEITEEELLKTMECMAMIEKHFSPEQLEALKKRERALGPEAIQAAQEEWPGLIASVKDAMNEGKDPASTEVQALAKRWKELIQAFSGGDKKIEGSLSKMYQAEPDMAAKQGLDPALFQYIGSAMRAGSKED